MNRIEFAVKEYRPDWGTWYGVVPLVDGVSLVDHVRKFEEAQNFDLAGGYGGIEPTWPDAENWVRYLLGEFFPEDNEPSNGTTWLLGCNCSAAGCWPLEARVSVEGDRVMWHSFRQPHRPAQDYSKFGPFVFGRSEYKAALEQLTGALASIPTQLGPL